MKRRELTKEEVEDAKRLKNLFDVKKRELNITQETLGEKMGFNSGQSTVSQYLNGKIPLNTDVALDFAKYLECEIGDFSPSLSAKLSAQRTPANTTNHNRLKNKNDNISFSVLAATGSMGAGVYNQLDHDFQIASLETTFKWAQRHLSDATDLRNVRIITAKGDSMDNGEGGAFRDGDLIFVDTGINSFDIDSVYVFDFGGQIFIKRISRTGKSFKVISDNKAYDSWTIEPDDFIDLRVLARVLTTAKFCR